MEDVISLLKKAKAASRTLALMPDATRIDVLKTLARMLRDNTDDILGANAKDAAAMRADDPRHDRLLLSKSRIEAIASDVEKVANLPCPLGAVQIDKTLPNGLHLQRIAVPLGCVGVIYEARPNVTVDVFALCFRSGNAAVLKGGKEAQFSNRSLSRLIAGALKEHGVDAATATLLPIDRESTAEMLNAVGLIDVCIPRGSQALIDYVRQAAKVPVIETGAGVVHVYFDAAGDVKKGREIINNSKTRRVSVCNALDTLLIHKGRLADLPALIEPMAQSNVSIFADAQSHAAIATSYPAALLHAAQAEDFGREYLDYKMSIKVVTSLNEALAHIAQYSSGHSEAIVTEDKTAAETFLGAVDAAAVYVNASTAFTDGGEFGMGAEIGISTQKLHARGPMALEALTSYKWLIHGDGQIRS